MEMLDREKPIYISAFNGTKLGRIIDITVRTTHTNTYLIIWDWEKYRDRDNYIRYKGAASRPRWITKIFRSKEAYEDALRKTKGEK